MKTIASTPINHDITPVELHALNQDLQQVVTGASIWDMDPAQMRATLAAQPAPAMVTDSPDCVHFYRRGAA